MLMNEFSDKLRVSDESDFLRGVAFLSFAFAGEEEDVDVGEDTAGSDSGVGHEFVKLFIIADCQLDVSGHNSGLLVVLSGISSEFKDLSSEVLKHSSQVDWSTSTNSVSISSLLHESCESSNRELKSSLMRSGDGS